MDRITAARRLTAHVATHLRADRSVHLWDARGPPPLARAQPPPPPPPATPPPPPPSGPTRLAAPECSPAAARRRPRTAVFWAEGTARARAGPARNGPGAWTEEHGFTEGFGVLDKCLGGREGGREGGG